MGDAASIPRSGWSPGEEIATHSSVCAWEIPWTEERHGLQSKGHRRVRHDWATKPQQPSIYPCRSLELKWLALPLSFLSVRPSHGETSKADASSILGSPWYCGNSPQHLIQTGVHKAQGSFISLLTWVRAQWNTNKAMAERNCTSRFWQEMMNNGSFFRCLGPYLLTFPLSLGWIGAATERCLLFSSSWLDSGFSGSC